MIEIRVVGADDWQLWRVLRLDALAGAPEAFGSKLADWQGSGDREDRWRARLSIPGAVDFVAFLDGEPVGMASGVPDADPAIVELISMWVSPAARSKQVADRLVEAVELAAVRRGAVLLRLSVVRENAVALQLYQRHGFAEFVAAEVDADADEVVLAKALRGAG